MEPSILDATLAENVTTKPFDMTESEYLEKMLGPKRLSLSLVLPITVVYAVIFVTGVFGNVATCFVISRNHVMQTATNYYLFSLALSDLTLLFLGLPNEISSFWQQYPWPLGLGLCKIRAYVSEMSSYVSVLTIVTFSMERYLAICHPLHLYAMSGLKRPIRFILAVWLVGLVCALPFAAYTTVNYTEFPPGSGRKSQDSAMCAMLLGNMPDFPLYELSCVIFFLVPMVLIMVLYVRMGLRIQSNNALGRTMEGAVHGETLQVQSRKAIIRMLSAVVITFFICWAPFHAQRLLYVHTTSEFFGEVNDWLYPLTGCLYYFSTTVNPILYNVMSAKYRAAFKATLCCSPGSPSITREDLSSVRETTLYRCGSRRESQLVRVRSLHYSRTVKRTLDHANDVLRADGDEERCIARSVTTRDRHSNHGSMGDGLQHDPKKTSVVMQSSNGKLSCRTAEENGISEETRI